MFGTVLYTQNKNVALCKLTTENSNSEFNTLEDWLNAEPVDLDSHKYDKKESRRSQSGMHPMELKLMVAPGKQI